MKPDEMLERMAKASWKLRHEETYAIDDAWDAWEWEKEGKHEQRFMRAALRTLTKDLLGLTHAEAIHALSAIVEMEL